MPIERIDAQRAMIDIYRDGSVQSRERKPGPPERIDGMSLGLVTMKAGEPSPHNGEMHPDGDEILLVTSGTIRVTCDTDPTPVDIGAGQACIISKGEWHNIACLEDCQLLHITPGPGGEARFK